METLIDCNIFAGVDELLISWIIGRLENEDIGAKLNWKDDSGTLCRTQEATFWKELPQ